jgi:serine/threonine protein kinase
LEDGSEVAVKRMLIESCEDAAENEMKILNYMKKNKSPFIVNYRHFLKDDTFLYLIVDLCEQTLHQHVHSKDIEYLQEHGRQIVKEVIAGLKFLHDERILHRDLKPSNVLVDVDGHMRLADFGISRVLNEDETTILTDTKGTEGWMAAEVIENMSKKMKGRFKKKSDIQSAGMIAFFILTKGEHPFGCTIYDRMANIVKGNPVDLNKLDNIDARQFVSRLISRNIHDRPTAQEAMLLPFLNGID